MRYTERLTDGKEVIYRLKDFETKTRRNAGDKLGRLEDLEEILKNGFIKNGRYHRQIFLAYIKNDWVICDNETNEKFSLNEVLKG